MKTPLLFKRVFVAIAALSALGGTMSCSSTPASRQEAQLKTTPPVVVNPRAEPKQVNLSEDMTVSRPVDVLADVKSFNSPIDKVRLRLFFSPETDQSIRFFKRPVEVEMSRLSGTTWRARLSSDELRMLAINGEKITYQGQVMAQNKEGQIAVSGQPVELTIQAPPVVQGRG